MDIKKFEMMKKKYEKQYEKFKKKYTELTNDEIDAIFMEWAKIKEKENKLKSKLNAKRERNRRNEARALIIFAKLVLKKYVKEQTLESILENEKDEFIKQYRKTEIDLREYIRNIFQNYKKQKSNSS